MPSGYWIETGGVGGGVGRVGGVWWVGLDEGALGWVMGIGGVASWCCLQ